MFFMQFILKHNAFLKLLYENNCHFKLNFIADSTIKISILVIFGSLYIDKDFNNFYRY